jgi:uncharacterized phage protein (TIGR01671 family)
MMREIKFRAFLKKHKVITKIIILHFNLNFIFHDHIEDNSISYFEDIELMQFTGILDKNGKEIYEGDIVLFSDWKPKVIAFKDKSFAGFTLKNTDLFLTTYDSERMEVIGNIYENPDLLNEGGN